MILCAAAVSAWLGRRQLPSPRNVQIWLDHLSHAGGLYAVSSEADISCWSHTLPPVPSFSFHAHVWKYLLTFVFGLCFVLGAVATPIQRTIPTQRQELEITDDVAAIQEQLETLKNQEAVPQQQLQEFQKQLEETIQNNDATAPTQTYDMLEHLNKRLKELGETAGDKLAQAIVTQEHLQQLLKQLPEHPDETLMSDLQQLFQQMAKESPALQEALSKAASEGKLDLSQIKQLTEQLQNMSQSQKKQLAELVQKKLVKNNCQQPGQCGGTNGSCDKPGYCNASTDYQAWLQEQTEQYSALYQCVQQGSTASPYGYGAGAPTRGPGVAPLNFTGKTDDFQGTYIDQTLSATPDLDKSSKILSVPIAPQSAETEQERAQAGSLQGSGKTVMQPDAAPIHPQHRQAVKNYFSTIK